MGLFGSSPPICPIDQHCSQWARKYMEYCLCSTKDGISLTLGIISVLSWGVAEIPQVITSYKDKSAEGLSIAFLMTWIVGDLLNVFGCMLEPATLPTQYYMAMLYTLTTSILTSQTIYYSHIYHRINKTRCHKGDVKKERQCSYSDINKQGDDEDGGGNSSIAVVSGVTPSSPIPLPFGPSNGSVERESYYMSARSLTRSHTPPTKGFYRVQRRSASVYEQSSVEEPLLGGPQSAPHSNPKTLLCVVFAVTFFLGTYNVQLEKISRLNMISESNRGVVMLVGRKLLQVSGNFTEGTQAENIGSFLGWGMAAIYMGGRLPQICLNIKRGNVQGLNPLMFVFALVGNITYVASILVRSLEWSKIRPNLPWLVDAGGCVVLDSFIIIQFIYFNLRKRRGVEKKMGTPIVS